MSPFPSTPTSSADASGAMQGAGRARPDARERGDGEAWQALFASLTTGATDRPAANGGPPGEYTATDLDAGADTGLPADGQTLPAELPASLGALAPQGMSPDPITANPNGPGEVAAVTAPAAAVSSALPDGGLPGQGGAVYAGGIPGEISADGAQEGILHGAPMGEAVSPQAGAPVSGTAAAQAAVEADGSPAAAAGPASPAAALADLLDRGPQGQGEAAYRAWAREVVQRAEAVARAEGLAASGADTDAPAAQSGSHYGTHAARIAAPEALLARLEQASYGLPAGQPTPGVAAAIAAAVAAAGPGAAARAEALQGWLQRIEAAAADGAQPAPAAPQAQPLLSAAGGERATPTWSLATPLHHAHWGEELGDRVRWMVGRQIQSAELKITPPQLGTIEVRISVHKDQMHISFSTPHAAVREALEDAVPRLRELMSGSGYGSVDVDVSQHSSPQQRRPGAGPYAAGEGGGEDAAVPAAAALAPSSRALGVIDLYA